MTDIRETIARAIADSICGGHVQWTDLGGRVRESYMGSASAVLSAIEAAGWVVVEKEPTYKRIRAMSESEADDDEGRFAPLMDLLGFSGENKTHTVLRAAYRAMIAAAPPLTPEAGKE
jgi:phage major head subunit gpT-like protein